jgi:hypothetical protein
MELLPCLSHVSFDFLQDSQPKRSLSLTLLIRSQHSQRVVNRGITKFMRTTALELFLEHTGKPRCIFRLNG